ncbi:hypothetical protein ESCO_002698 [Escovopsis weberi]|uniref:Uncharacterized protein n=1 Tax=Escovopsis weberi TaxID=150374 RepID=A0A0M8N1T0_ESCWE|nr:hypothetical protein ESCO_002698 [Escovopsis weberi]
MGNHRAQAQFERARWKILYLIPLWSLQLVLSMLLLGLFSRRLGDTTRARKEDAAAAAADIPAITFVWESINIVMSFVLALCTAVDVAKYFAETLTPQTMLITNAVKTACAVTILALDIVVYVQRRDQQYSLVGLVVDITLLCTTATTIVYAAVAHRRSAAYDAYAHPVNVKGYGFSDSLSYYSDGSYSSRLSMRSSVEKPARASFGSIRTARTSSEQHRLQQPQHQQQRQRQQQQPLMSPPSEPMFQTSSGQYNHERSTKFEEFMSLYGPLHRSSEPDTAYRSQTQNLGFREAKTVGRPRGASTGSRGKGLSGEQVLRSVPEEDADAGEIEIAAPRSADGMGSDVSTASAPLMSGSEHDELIVVKKRAPN